MSRLAMSPESQGLHIDPRLLQSLKGIPLKSRMLVRGMYNNRHRTSDFGASNEFIDHRDYQRGDAIRSVDWRVFARTDRFYVKRYEMEANMRVQFLLDTSDSMRVPPPAGLPSKLDLGAVLVGAAATLVIFQQDAAGLCFLGDKVEERIPARQGMDHLAQLYQHLERPRGKGGGNFGALVAQVTGHLRVRGMVFAVTDALDDLPPLFDALKSLAARQHDVTLFQVLDKDELEFPYDRLTEFRHPERNAKVVGDPIALRGRYLTRLHEHLAAIEDFCKRTRIDYLRLHNGEDLVALLRSHFLKRLARRMR